ncbi:hypothetical protein M0813_28065 [Anaeramoeba flamelloides]|uniref:Peptidase M12B domain-containing protein n=1 Tax=Anaeramoeba flamelloides TaxID=1746091 RepID=A0ABQ8XXJ4_9EUKA|nr:hypothetical protein M0813_28065 [Anaeramoeba flamelloides]
MKNLILIYLVLIALVSSTRIISVLDHSLQDDKTLLSTSEGVVVGIAPELLSRNLEVGSELFLDLGSSYRYEGKVKSKNTDVNGVTTYVAGLAASKFGHAIISVANGQVRMNVDIPSEGKNFGVRHNKGINEHILFEHNLSDVLEGTHPGYLPNKDSKNGMFQKSPDAGKKIQAGVDDPAILDVLVVYTTAAFSWAGDQESMDLVISSMIAKSNEALTTSETGIVINLVHSALVEYEEIDPVTDINNLTTPSQEVFQEVHDLRDQYYADFVVLLEYTDQTGGIGWLLENSDGDESLAFSITRIQQASFSYTTIHEIGHNMGCGHHKEQNFQEGPGRIIFQS